MAITFQEAASAWAMERAARVAAEQRVAELEEQLAALHQVDDSEQQTLARAAGRRRRVAGKVAAAANGAMPSVPEADG